MNLINIVTIWNDSSRVYNIVQKPRPYAPHDTKPLINSKHTHDSLKLIGDITESLTTTPWNLHKFDHMNLFSKYKFTPVKSFWYSC